MKAQRLTILTLSPKDYDFLLSVLNLKLSEDAMKFFFRGETTSKCESLNKCISKSYPKNKTFSRVGESRVYSAIGRANNSLMDFTLMKCRAMKCHLPPDSVGYKILSKYHRKRFLTRMGQKHPAYMRRKHALIEGNLKEYFTSRLKVTNEDEYHKFQLDSAKKAKDSALAALGDAHPGPATSLENHVTIAKSAYDNLKHVLDHAYNHSMAKIRAARRAMRHRRLTMLHRNTVKRTARRRGSQATRSIRNEHSYGTLQ